MPSSKAIAIRLTLGNTAAAVTHTDVLTFFNLGNVKLFTCFRFIDQKLRTPSLEAVTYLKSNKLGNLAQFCTQESQEIFNYCFSS